MSEGKNPKFLALNHETISRDLQGKKTMAHRFTILRPVSAGFASAPYKLKSSKRDPDAKVLSEVHHGEDGRAAMTMWSFKKQGTPGNKGPRSDLNWTLQIGNTIKMWLDEDRAKDGELLAADVPAFTVCEISVASKNEDSVQGGWCIRITTVRPVEFSLHSMTRDFQLLCSNLGEARAREMTVKARQPLLEKELESQAVAFWAPVRREAQIDEAGGSVKLVNWGEGFPVELPTEALMSATNCRRVDWACAMLEVAIAAGAASVLVISNEFWKGGPRGVPVICAETLLCGIAGPGIYATPFKMEVEGAEAAVELEVGADKLAVPGCKPPACDDFELAGLDTELAEAYPIQFNLKCDGKTIPAVWKGYLNAGPTRFQAAVGKRKRVQTMDE